MAKVRDWKYRILDQESLLLWVWKERVNTLRRHRFCCFRLVWPKPVNVSCSASLTLSHLHIPRPAASHYPSAAYWGRKASCYEGILDKFLRLQYQFTSLPIYLQLLHSSHHKTPSSELPNTSWLPTHYIKLPWHFFATISMYGAIGASGCVQNPYGVGMLQWNDVNVLSVSFFHRQWKMTGVYRKSVMSF